MCNIKICRKHTNHIEDYLLDIIYDKSTYPPPRKDSVMGNLCTIRRSGTAEYDVKRSRFIANTAHIENESEAKAFVAKIKKKYYDARHTAYAWISGERGEVQKSSDDGEPGGSAGAPILDVMQHMNLTNSIITVTRYFGGIKLGTGGLVRAYGHTASMGLNKSLIVERRLVARHAVTLPYTLLGTVENYLRAESLNIEDTSYSADVCLIIQTNPDESAAMLQELADLTAGRAPIKKHDEQYIELLHQQ